MHVGHHRDPSGSNDQNRLMIAKIVNPKNHASIPTKGRHSKSSTEIRGIGRELCPINMQHDYWMGMR